MSYQVLARKYRPATFHELEGQDHVSRALVNALENERLHHAYLFTGTRGVGKTTIARILAKCLNCETGVTARPCGSCGACREVAEGRSVDLMEVDAASRTGVDDMRDLLDNVQYMPSVSRFKVYLIDEVHMLSKSSFNAMLKTLEEPPEHVKFLFATTDPRKLPVTVLSRCLQFNLKNLTPEQIVKYLGQVLGTESVSYEEPALWLLGHAADGSMRDALSLTDQAISFGNKVVSEKNVREMLGAMDRREIFLLLESIIDEKGEAVLEKVGQLAEFAPDYAAMLDEILSILHRLAIVKAVPGALDNSQGDQRLLESLEKKVSAEHIQLLYQIGLLGQRDLHYAPSIRVGFEMALLRMLSFTLDPSAVVPEETPPRRRATPAEGLSGEPPAPPASDGKVKDARARPVLQAGPAVSRAEQAGVRRQEAAAGREPWPTSDALPEEPSTLPLVPELWPQVLDTLGLDGVARELAANCNLKSSADEVCSLVLDKRHASLWNRNCEERIARMLGEKYGRKIRVRIEAGVTEEDTPAKVRARALARDKAKAVEAVGKDDRVRQLIERFGGRLESIDNRGLPG